MHLEQEATRMVGDIARETTRSIGTEFFRSLAQSLAQALDVRYCMATECVDSPPTRVRSMAFWADGALQPNFEYSLLATPCEKVIAGEACVYGHDIRSLFPDDDDLVTLEAESYAAVPVLDSANEVLGHLVVMDSKPFVDTFPGLPLLQVFAERVAAEMERRRVTGKLADSEARLRQVIDLVPHFIFAKDRQGRFILVNRAVADAYGTTTEELLGKTDADFGSSADEVESFRRDDLEVIDSGRVKEVDEVITDHSGALRHLQTTKIPFEFARSDMPSVLGVSIDVTRQRRLEEHQRELREQMLHVQKLESLGVLAGGLAHDFNNLLTSMVGNIHLMKGSMAEDAPPLRYLREIEVAVRRSAELVRQMLAYSGKGTFVVAHLDLNATIRELKGLLETSISKKTRLELDLAADLPEVLADGTQIRQVVMNLITNASEAFGGQPGTVIVRTAVRRVDREFLAAAYLASDLEPGEYLAIEVVDRGCGMDEETQARLFDPFFSTKATGRGLGMAALLGIVRGHDGAVHVTSRVGEGSTFTVLLPAAVAADPVEEPIDEPAVVAGGRRSTILLVDDEKIVRRVTKLLIERAGFDVLTAGDGDEACQIFARRHHEIGAVVLDMLMPKLDGLETLRELRAIDPAAKVLLSSGFSEPEALENLGAAGPTDFLEKPYDPVVLEAKLRQLIDG